MNITNTLPNSIDNFLQDVAQIWGGIDYKDISDFAKIADEEDIKKLSSFCRSYNRAAESDDSDGYTSELLQKRANDAALLVQRKLQDYYDNN